MTTYVVKHNQKYLKFGSYSKATPHDSLAKASLYSSERLAKANLKACWIDGVKIAAKDLKVAECTLQLTNERDL